VTDLLARARELTGRSRALTITASVVVALLLATVIVPSRAPFGIVLQGALYGSVTGLLGLGLVLTYRSDRIINFSYGAMGGVGGSVGVLLYLGKHWNYVVCLLIGLAVGALVGAGTETLVIRRFARAPRLILTVATIGVFQILGAIELVQQSSRYDTARRLVEEEEVANDGPTEDVAHVTDEALRTLAERGALALTRDGEWYEVRAARVERVVDTNGAGDAFLAGVVAGELRGLALERSLALAARVAALAVGSPDLAPAEPVDLESLLSAD